MNEMNFFVKLSSSLPFYFYYFTCDFFEFHTIFFLLNGRQFMPSKNKNLPSDNGVNNALHLVSNVDFSFSRGTESLPFDGVFSNCASSVEHCHL